MHGVANHINEMKRENEKVLYMQVSVLILQASAPECGHILR